ncbi:MAG: MBL fold metallo-hydrolase [Candidatus Paceibacterota bacterium]|jgi:metallo-beta-lactamase family protein|nr:MBL fold metallo-hydrolase [Candidatus Paceibacterota bacterium]
MKAKLTFAGGTGGPTGANFLFETSDKKILIDCGLTQGDESAEDLNREMFPFDPGAIDILFVTHAHIDHIGRIPFLIKNGFRGKIYSTPPTRDLAEPMLDDTLSLMIHEERKKGTEPLYDAVDIRQALSLWTGIEYRKEIPVSDDLSVVFHDAGHVLGSAMIEVRYGKKKMLFTGDLGNSPSSILRDTEYVPDIDYVLMESVYGDREHEHRDERRDLLEDVVKESVKKKGVLLIPVFSLERTQDILFEINELVESGKIPAVPVFLDSPLGIKITEIYKKNKKYFNASAQAIIQGGDDIFQFPKLHFTADVEDSKAIRGVHPPKIILAGSGMSNGGRILHHEKEYLSDPKTTLLFVGYQAVGTPGRLLENGEKTVRIMGEEIKVRAHTATIHGYSAHRDMNGLFDFVDQMSDTVQKVFVVMGEPKAATFLSQRIHDYLGLDAVVPRLGESIELEF